MSAEKLYSEIFEEFGNATTKADRIAVLRKYDHPRFRDFLEAAFNPGIIFDVQIPTYRPALEPAGMNFAYLDSEVSKLYRFIKNHPKRTDVTPDKLSRLLAIVLESLHKDEAALLVKTIKKDIGVPYLTPKLIKEAFGDNILVGV